MDSAETTMVPRYVVKVAAWLEILTGAIVVVAPVVPCVLLFGAKPESIGKPLSGMLGIALLALGSSKAELAATS